MKQLPNKFPSISRTITERSILIKPYQNWLKILGHNKTKKTFSIFSIILTLFLIIILTGFTMYLGFRFSQNLQKFTQVQAQRAQIQSKINFWNSISQKYDGYSGAYFNMAALFYELSDFRSARLYLNKALILNPDDLGEKTLDLRLKKSGY